MNNTISNLLRLLLVVVLPINTVLAGDEDMLTPYSVFDPETGFFITEDPRTGSPTHDTTTQDSKTEVSETITVKSVTVEDLSESDSSENLSLPMIMAGLILLIGSVGAILWFRKS